MKSTLFNMVTVLFVITLIASAGVGLVNMVTVDPIAAAKAKAVDDAILAVLPPFSEKSVKEIELDNMPVKVYTTSENGETVGYAVETMTKKGFNGIVKLMVGFAPTGEILNINVIEQAETPGLGTHMCDEDNNLIKSVKGKNPASMQLVKGRLAVTKDGGDVDALTAATISSRAYVDAVNRAYMAYKSVAGGEFAAEKVADEARKGGNNE